LTARDDAAAGPTRACDANDNELLLLLLALVLRRRRLQLAQRTLQCDQR